MSQPMGLINWARNAVEGFDAGTVERAQAGVLDQRQHADAAVAEAIKRRAADYAVRDAESVSPEILGMLESRMRAARVQPNARMSAQRVQTMDRKAQELGELQQALGLSDGAAMPLDGKIDPAVLMERLRAMGVGDRGGVVPGSAPSADVQALAAVMGRLDPGMRAGVHNALAAANQTLADKPLARVGAYSGAGAGAVAAVPLVTDAGRSLLELIGLLNSEATDQSGYS